MKWHHKSEKMLESVVSSTWSVVAVINIKEALGYQMQIIFLILYLNNLSSIYVVG